ncbi:MAG TPA: twin-arginine translocation signal domain-containing protein, partial [Anaerolineales bacterium]|nr:twin-arginine translocation signal domain-containing protein [Anaerolineales bacterium]
MEEFGHPHSDLGEQLYMDIKNLSRRDFLTVAGLTGAGLGLAACSTPASAPAATTEHGGAPP